MTTAPRRTPRSSECSTNLPEQNRGLEAQAIKRRDSLPLRETIELGTRET